METILGNNWYTAVDVARVLQVPLSEAEAIIQHCIEGGRVPVADYPDPDHKAISGYVLRQIAGQRQPRPYMRQ